MQPGTSETPVNLLIGLGRDTRKEKYTEEKKQN